MKYPSLEEKLDTVIFKNTFYFYDEEFEEVYEGHIFSLAQNIFHLKNIIDQKGLKESTLVDYLINIEDGLEAILTITGFSKESLQRLVTFIRLTDYKALSELVYKDSWPIEDFRTEWSLKKIKSLIKTNRKFAEGIVNLFFRGPTIPELKIVLPLFELKKLDLNKFKFSIESLVDTIVRYRTKGSYKAARKGNPEALIEKILKSHELNFDKGKLGNIPRTMDFIVPDKVSPRLIIECSYLVTTGSGMGDKAKTEKTVADYLKENYPDVIFVGFVDGIGWYVRKGDLHRIVEAYDFVFTFHKEELQKFDKLLEEVFQ
jgi:hypothetical protein